ncbi:hypothetical protein [Planctomicrobium sp. SH527]|uniref:hypothetical protein n=1 Tax=Planctomicrobium sp. SH527 TaxID=3448123 RepID=UPI003F5C3D84
MALVTRDQFLSFGSKRRFKIVPVPGLGDVRIRSLKESERSAYEAERFTEGEIDSARTLDSKSRLIALCVCDAEGEPFLTATDVVTLNEKDGAFTGLMFDECWKHCGFTRKDIETIVGNLSETPTDDSP